jgi:V/A-type H+-transporting ATPase subunit C
MRKDMPNTNRPDTDYLFLSASIRARESKMLTADKLGRIADAGSFADAAKLLVECGFPDMSSFDAAGVESALSQRRTELFEEFARNEVAVPIVDMFRLIYDYHNVKVLVKSTAVEIDASKIMSLSGRVSPGVLEDAFVADEHTSIPTTLSSALEACSGILRRTGNPQLSDIAADRAYFKELSDMGTSFGNPFIEGYIKLLIDVANLKTFVRAVRIGKDADFIKNALIPYGNADVSAIAAIAHSGDGIAEVFNSTYLANIAPLAVTAIKGGSQTEFERQCDNAPNAYLSAAKLGSFGPAVVFTYLAELEWETVAVRMVLTGKLMNIRSDITKERLRDSYV